jgi:hypothetical protein
MLTTLVLKTIAAPVATKTVAVTVATKAVAATVATKTVAVTVATKTIAAPALIKTAAVVTAKSVGFSFMWPVALICIGGYGAYKILAESFDPQNNPDQKKNVDQTQKNSDLKL